MATIYDVSFLAGVSLATVSRVVNNTGKVSEKTRQKVHDAMAQLDYRPNTIAQSLASNRSNSVGVLVSQLDGPFYGPMMREVESALRAANKHVIIAAGHSDAAQEKEAVEFLLSRGCDALIVDAEILSNEYLQELCSGKTPVVLINRHVDGIEERCVHLNNLQGGLLASRHVLAHGHSRIAYISGPLFKLDARERLEGHKQALAEKGLEFDDALFFEGDFREEGGFEGMAALLERGVPSAPWSVPTIRWPPVPSRCASSEACGCLRISPLLASITYPSPAISRPSSPLYVTPSRTWAAWPPIGY